MIRVNSTHVEMEVFVCPLIIVMDTNVSAQTALVDQNVTHVSSRDHSRYL